VLALLPSLCRLIDIGDGNSDSVIGEPPIASLPVKEVVQETAITMLQRLSDLSDSMFGATNL